MNKIYKSIWNHVTRTFTAVSEIQQTNGKKAKAVSTVAGICLSFVLGANSSLAYDDGEDVDISNTVTIGTNTPFREESDTNFYGESQILVPENIGSATLSSDVLMDLSSGIEEQTVIYTDRLGDWLDRGGMQGLANGQVSLLNNLVHQKQLDANQNHVATLTFAIGSEADRLIRANTGTYGQLNGIQEITDDHIRIDGVEGEKNYDKNGISYHAGPYLGADRHYVWTLALLKQADIVANQTLVFDNLNGTHQWSAKTSGAGNIEYRGSGVLNIQSMIVNAFDANDSNVTDANDYTGTTTITGEGGQLTVNLYKSQSFGQTSGVTASNATINVIQSDAWESTGGLHLTDSSVNFNANQSEFTVTNTPGETANTATFSGTNSISGGANSFTYLIRGDAQVVDGTTTFAGTNIKTQVAGSLTLHSVGGIANDTAIEIGGALNFVGAGATPTKQTLTQTFAAYDDTDDKYTVNLSEGSNIKYASGSILSGVLTTSLSDVSKLETDNQSNLGNLVMFNRQSDKARSQLTLKLASGAENLTLTTNLSGDGLTILDAGQDDGTNAKISLDSGVDLSNYSGWIRLQNGTMSLTPEAANMLNTDNGIQTGLSLGSGSTLVINDTTGAQIIENFGWSTASAGGVLDLSGFTFKGTKDAALNVDSIQVGASNVIRVDIAKLAVDANVQEGYILDLDNSNPTQLLVSGTLSDS